MILLASSALERLLRSLQGTRRVTAPSARSSSGGFLHHELRHRLAPDGTRQTSSYGTMGFLLLVACALVASGCVSPQEKAAEVIPDVPYDLLGPATTTTEPPPEVEGGFKLDLYFLAEEDDSLWRVTRSREQRAGIQEALELLVAGPTEAESELLAVRARLSESLNPVAGQPVGGLLSITVADEAQFRDNTNNRLSTQVIVCTMTQFNSVDAVELRDSSGPIPLSGIDAETIGERARRSNYDDCAAGDLFEVPPEDQPDATVDLSGDGEADSTDQ